MWLEAILHLRPLLYACMKHNFTPELFMIISLVMSQYRSSEVKLPYKTYLMPESMRPLWRTYRFRESISGVPR